jgi:asparagine synthase (glutamine-hydrolysing)
LIRGDCDSPEDLRQVSEVCSELRETLETAVERNRAPCMLLSGGLDTSLLAAIASRRFSFKAITVTFDGAEAPDLAFARRVADYLGLQHIVHCFNWAEVLDTIPQVVKVIRTFDPMEVRNDVAIFIALKHAKANNLTATITGDGCDELFAGYSFLLEHDAEHVRIELEKMWKTMSFASVPMASALDMEAKLPFLDPEIKLLATKLDPKYLVRGHQGRRHGKWILRKAFERILPDDVIWRMKTPIEWGTGTTVFPRVFDRSISDTEFEAKVRRYVEEDEVILGDKEHLFYYEIYRSIFGIPRRDRSHGKTCPKCRSNIPPEVSYCRTCGAFPICGASERSMILSGPRFYPSLV